MNDAPERVWLAHNGGLPSGNYPQERKKGYVREDLHTALQARLAEVEAERDKAAIWATEQHACADSYALRLGHAEARVKELEAQPAPTHQIVVWAEGPHFLAQDVARDIMTQGPTELEAWERLAALIAVEVYGATVSWTAVQPAPEVAALVEALLRARDWIHGGGDRPGPILRQIDAAIAGMEGRRDD
jgi:hypothetical protein